MRSFYVLIVKTEPSMPSTLPDLSPHRVIGQRRLRRAVMIERSTAIKSDLDAEVDRLLAEFDQDPRAAMKALLHDLDLIVEDYEASISKGYVRGSVTA